MSRKPSVPPTPPQCGRTSLGLSPAVQTRRKAAHKNEDIWCPPEIPFIETVDYDHWCDKYEPKTITYKDVVKARRVIKETIQTTPLLLTKIKPLFDMELYLKLEMFNTSGSFHERSAIYALHKLSSDQRNNGVYTASIGNWGMALAHIGKKMETKVTVVLPVKSSVATVRRCQSLGANVVIQGRNLMQARLEAFNLIKKHGTGTYINGYDHPHVIAGAGTIGIEILEQLPDVDAILIPVGGGGLLAGIATVVKSLKPDTLVYGVESYDSCCFFKALDNEMPYETECLVPSPLAVPTAGYNSFHTARSLVDKMVLVNGGWINQAILRMTEEERYIVEVSGAVALAAVLADPYIVPELRNKKVVCVVSGGNVDSNTLARAYNNALLLDGRAVSMKITLPISDTKELYRVLNIISNLRGDVTTFDSDNACISEHDLYKTTLTVMCATRDLQHSCILRRVLHKLFPNRCEFAQEPFIVKTECPCFPKLWSL